MDDNPFLRDADGRVHPAVSRFHRFAESVVAAGPFERASYLVPVSQAPAGRELLPPVDDAALDVVPTAPFDGAAGYLVRFPVMLARNARRMRRTIGGADLLWIKAPASNAILAAVAARATGTPRFAYIAGSAREVVGARSRSGLGALPARVAAWAYDGVTTLLARTGPAVRLGADVFTTDVTAAEVARSRERRNGAPAAANGTVRLAWAGRVAPEKGLADLLEVVAASRANGRDLRLRLIGDGVDRLALESRSTALGLADAVEWTGFVADRDRYLELLGDSDMFVLPSRTEGVPKVALDAMAVGLPIVASAVGGIPSVVADGQRGLLTQPGDRRALGHAIEALAADPDRRRAFGDAGLDWAAAHTRELQAARLVAWMRDAFPGLPWPEAAAP